MATPQPPSAAEAEKKPKVEGGQQRFHNCTFTPKKPAFAAPTQGLEHIIFDNTGATKAASTFNLNIKAISEHLINCLKYDGLFATLAVCELKEPTIEFPMTHLTTPPSLRQCTGNASTITPTTNRNSGPRTPRKSTIW
jgi:hypothetical protein